MSTQPEDKKKVVNYYQGRDLTVVPHIVGKDSLSERIYSLILRE